MRMLKRMIWNLVSPVFLRRVLGTLRRELLATRSIPEWVDFAYSFHERLSFPWRIRNLFSIAPSQVKSEILRLLGILQRLQPRRILEIGTHKGGTLFLFARIAALDATIISLDLPGRLERSGIPSWRNAMFPAFAAANQKVHLIRADSHSLTALAKTRAVLTSGELDFLFIDADHTYEGIRQDFEMYSPLVRNGGLVIFHDIVADYGTKRGVETWSHAGEVYRFWRELRNEYRVLEIVENPDQDGSGIGILTIGGERK